jgi:hypothetical protein
MQKFYFAANNIPENPTSRACLDWFVRRGGGFPEVVHYYRGQGNSPQKSIISNIISSIHNSNMEYQSFLQGDAGHH